MPDGRPAIGAVEDGYRFTGGDPSLPGNWTAVTAAEQAGPLARSVYGVGRGLNDLVEGIYQTVLHPADTARGIYGQTAEHLRQAQQEPSLVGKLAEYGAAVPVLGPFGQQLGERAAGGDIAGAVSEGLTAAAAPSLLKEMPSPRAALASHMYTPEGALKPGLKFASKLAGAGLGEATGIPYGGLAGWLSGPEAVRTLFPNPDAALVERGKWMSRGYKSAAPEEAAGPAGTPTPFVESSGVSGTIARPYGPLVIPASEYPAELQRFEMAKRAASRRGTEFAGGQVPGEGRSVPQRPLRTLTEEYGGPRGGKRYAFPFEGLPPEEEDYPIR